MKYFKVVDENENTIATGTTRRVVLPDGAVELTQEEYETGYAAYRAPFDEVAAQLQAEAEAEAASTASRLAELEAEIEKLKA